MRLIVHFIVRLRIVLARHSWIRWLLVLGLASAIGWAGHQRTVAVERQRASWGTTVDVIVARTDLEPDQLVDAARDVEVLAMPVALVPLDAVRALPDDARLRQHVVAGAMLTTVDLVHASGVTASGPAALAEPGTAVVGIVDTLARGVPPGQRVAVASNGVTLTSAATVVRVDDEIVFVAMPRDDAPLVAAAAREGTASLILLP